MHELREVIGKREDGGSELGENASSTRGQIMRRNKTFNTGKLHFIRVNFWVEGVWRGSGCVPG